MLILKAKELQVKLEVKCEVKVLNWLIFLQ